MEPQPITISADQLHEMMMDFQQQQHVSQDTLHNMMTSSGYGQDAGGQGQQTANSQPGTPPAYDSGSVQDYVKSQSDNAFGANEWPALHRLLMNESGFQPTVINKSSGAGGLFQFLPSTFANYGGSGNAADAPVEKQVEAGLNYIRSRYGTPGKALDFWNNVAPTMSEGGGSHWY